MKNKKKLRRKKRLKNKKFKSKKNTRKKIRKRIKKIKLKRKIKFKKKIKKRKTLKHKKKVKKNNYKFDFKKLIFSQIKAPIKKIIESPIKKIKTITFKKIFKTISKPLLDAYDDFKQKKKIELLKQIDLERKEKIKKIQTEAKLRKQIKEQELKDEIKLARERSYDLKKFIRQEQAALRKEQAEKRRKFLEEIKLEKKIESFRKRELQEIKNIEKLALKEQRDDYRSVEDRLEKIKDKYRLIREQKIRERVRSLGIDINEVDTKEDILKKEKEFAENRQRIELILESFYRSANSLVFQLNKKYIPKHKSILRVIDRRYETNECFIRYDDSPDDDWIILIYLEDSDLSKGKIVVENKANPEKHETKSFHTKDIFIYSDYLVDTMTAHIDRERQKKNN